MAQDGGSVLHRRQRLHPTRRRSPHPDQRRGRPPRRPHQNLRVRGDGLFRALVARADFRAKDPSSNPRRRAPPEFVNGGWCMHDEATAHVADMLEQTTRGHAFIAREFGTAALPRVGWQLDPFGHAKSTQATHLKRRRIRRRVSRPRVRRRHRREGSPPRHGIHVARLRHARRRRGRQGNATEQIRQLRSSPGAPPRPSRRRGPSVAGRTVAERLQRPRQMVARFERAAAEQAGWFQGADANEKGGRGGDVMFTMGTDFTYGAAGYWYDQLDRLVRTSTNARAIASGCFTPPRPRTSTRNSPTRRCAGRRNAAISSRTDRTRTSTGPDTSRLDRR